MYSAFKQGGFVGGLKVAYNTGGKVYRLDNGGMPHLAVF